MSRRTTKVQRGGHRETTPNEVIEKILYLARFAYPQKAIAEEVGVSQPFVSATCRKNGIRRVERRKAVAS